MPTHSHTVDLSQGWKCQHDQVQGVVSGQFLACLACLSLPSICLHDYPHLPQTEWRCLGGEDLREQVSAMFAWVLTNLHLGFSGVWRMKVTSLKNVGRSRGEDV